MPGMQLKALYKGKTLADLKYFYDVSKINARKPQQLCTSAQKLYDQAVKDEQAGDEEMSYIYYMKYLSVITMVQKSKDYANDKAYFDKMIGTTNVHKALDKAEKLSKSLEMRYKLLSEKAAVDATLLEQEKYDAKAEEKKRLNKDIKEKNIPSNGVLIADVSDVSLSSNRLFTLLQDKKINILLLDARSLSNYAESHMTFSQCINVPQEIVKAGISAAAMAKLLPPESQDLFRLRSSADLVVLFDWSTTESMLSPGSNLYTLKNILLKWDPGVIYKNQPLILEGGFEDWLLRYPQFTTNPHAKPPPAYDLFSDFLLGDIEYPTLNDSLPDRSTKPAIVEDGRPPNLSMEIGSSLRPGIDRGSKAAAIQTYEERSKTVAELLEASEKGAATSLQIARNRLQAENDWEILRLRKEKEAEEEMKCHLQKREEDLLLNIDRLEEKQRCSDAENQVLRSQLDAYRKKDADETTRIIDKQIGQKEIEMDSRIRKKEEEMMLVAKEREAKAKERLRKVEEDRKKRKQEEERKRQLDELERGKQDKNKNGTYFTPLQTDLSSNSTLSKRSHSSPNIAQMMDDEDLTVKQKAPQFDRAIKPLQKPLKSDVNAAWQRNFNGVLGRAGKGLTGLKNLGNTCYMNSIIQCINNTEPIAEYFCAGTYRADVNFQNKTRGEIVLEVGAVVRALWCGQYRSVACNDLKDVVGKYKDEFRGNQQQDSHEFLFFLINWLHDDLNKSASNKKMIKDAAKDRLSDAEKQWYDFKRCNDTIILTLFYGQQKSTVRCDVCGKESSTYEPFNHLSLPLPNSGSRCTISECMKLYLSGERISGWKCPDCKELRDATKKFDLLRLPRILVIHFKRFFHDGWSGKKQTYVDFPLERLDMETFTPIPQQRYTRYELYGVSNHYGTIEGGHYTAYCKNVVYGKWYKFDDSEVTDIPSSDIKSGAAYILFYTALDNKVPFNR